jgi:hypothetical protein
MTPTLEQYFHHTAKLSLQKKYQENGCLMRHIILTDDQENPFEVAALQICVNKFPKEAQKLINECKTPLGTIYKMFTIAHKNKLEAFYEVTPNKFLSKVFRLTEQTFLYSRLNNQLIEDDQSIALALEILPPLHNRAI